MQDFFNTRRNCIVVGGGEQNKFGNDLVRRLREEGNRVYTISHKHYDDPLSATANFSSIDDVVAKFKEVSESMDTIDLLVYNTNPIGYPNTTDSYTSTAKVNPKLYYHGFNIHVVLPHMIVVEALKKMNENSKIVFMVTECIFQKERTEFTDKVGYYGGKAYQHQLMLALSNYNDKNAIVTSVSPYFDYNDRKKYTECFSEVYDYILNCDESSRGTVYNGWEKYT